MAVSVQTKRNGDPTSWRNRQEREPRTDVREGEPATESVAVVISLGIAAVQASAHVADYLLSAQVLCKVLHSTVAEFWLAFASVIF